MLGRGQGGVVRFKGRTKGGAKEDFVQVVGLEQLDGKGNVAKMDRIKGAAKKTDGF